MLYQASGPIAQQVLTRPSYLNKSTDDQLHPELSQLVGRLFSWHQRLQKSLFILTKAEIFSIFSAWAKASLHCWKSTSSAFSLYLAPAVWKRRAENKHFSNQAEWLKGFCVRGILSTYLNHLNKRDSWVTSRGNSLRWLGQLLAEAQVLTLSTEVSLASTGSAWTHWEFTSLQQHRLEQGGRDKTFLEGNYFL